jgi:ATP phosphoribosyltransferase
MTCALEKGRAHGNVVQMLKEMGMALENWSYRQQKMLVRAKKNVHSFQKMNVKMLMY